MHCLMLPVLIPLLPLVGASIFAGETFEHIVLFMSLVIGAIALFAGFHKYHRKLYPLYSLAIGGVIYFNKDMFGEEWKPLVLTVGAVLIVSSHILNIKLCKSCTSCEH